MYETQTHMRLRHLNRCKDMAVNNGNWSTTTNLDSEEEQQCDSFHGCQLEWSRIMVINRALENGSEVATLINQKVIQQLEGVINSRMDIKQIHRSYKNPPNKGYTYLIRQYHNGTGFRKKISINIAELHVNKHLQLIQSTRCQNQIKTYSRSQQYFGRPYLKTIKRIRLPAQAYNLLTTLQSIHCG
ncbi:MAG: hypothetical protein EZS28_041043, partial [Streblomastix strix]